MNIDEVYDVMDTRNNIKKILDEMNVLVNDIGLGTGLTAPEVYELISTVSKFMIGKKDDSAKTEMSSFISSIDDHNLPGVHILRLELILSYINRRIALISGSSDSAWKIMYLMTESFQNLYPVGNKVDDDNVNNNIDEIFNEKIGLISGSSDDDVEAIALNVDCMKRIRHDVRASDEKTELKNITNELKELAEFFDIAVISAQQLNRAGTSVVDAADDKKSLIVNKKSNGRADYFEKIDLSSCIYVCGYDRFIDFRDFKMKSPAVVIRAGYGNQISQKDEKFEEYYKNAKANGLKVGAYWYSYAHTAEEAIKEVRAFIYVIADKQFDMPIVFDIEQNFLLNNTSVITMRTEIITLVRSYCNLYGFNVQFITLNEDGKIVSIDNDTN